MKRMDTFCASQAATAICLSMEKKDYSSSPSSSSSAILLGGAAAGKAIDRHNPLIRDSRRSISKSLPPLPNYPHKLLLKKKTTKIPAIEDKHHSDGEEKVQTKVVNEGGAAIVRKSWSCTRPGDFLSPPTSARFLLREKVVNNNAALSDSDSAKLSVEEIPKMNTDEPGPDLPEQVVVLRVSLHCRGCERKLRKHLSRMEGLTSFNIDFAAKKVTVAGKVTPLGVLSSISKVKNAQLWSPTISSSITPSINREYLKIQE